MEDLLDVFTMLGLVLGSVFTFGVLETMLFCLVWNFKYNLKFKDSKIQGNNQVPLKIGMSDFPYFVFDPIYEHPRNLSSKK